MDNEQQELLRQSANEALVSLVLPMVFEVMSNAADAVAHDLEIEPKQAKDAIIAQWLKYIAKYPQHALNTDILSIWASYHPAMDYEQGNDKAWDWNPYEDDDSDDTEPPIYGNVA